MQKMEKQTNKEFYGRAVFQQTFNKQLIQSESAKVKLKRKHWHIQFNAYQKQNWKEIFAKMVQCEAWHIGIYLSQTTQIIKQIQHVDYIKLASLSLSKNNIDNIQGISMINFSQLTHLYLYQNHINRITSFKKILNKFIHFLDLRSNQLYELNSLTRLNIQQS